MHKRTYVHTHIHTHSHTLTNAHTRARVHTHTYVRAPTRTHAHIHTQTYTYTYTHTHTHTHTHTLLISCDFCLFLQLCGQIAIKKKREKKKRSSLFISFLRIVQSSWSVFVLTLPCLSQPASDENYIQISMLASDF